MISISEEHYSYLLELINSLHRNFNLLLHEKEKFVFNQLKQDFTKINSQILQSLEKIQVRCQQQKVILVQYEDQNNILKQKGDKMAEQMKRKQEQIARQRVELNRVQKQLLKQKDLNKTIKLQLNTKANSLKQMEEEFKAQLKGIKRQYKEENKQLKSKIKSLEKLLETAMSVNNQQEIQNQLDKQLEELRKMQQEAHSAPSL